MRWLCGLRLWKALGLSPPRSLGSFWPSLTNKPSGGFRPIGVFPSWYRVWGRCRRGEALRWELAYKRDYWAAGAFRGAGDVVWRQAFRAESGALLGQCTASVFWDLREHYEHIDLEYLWQKCLQHRFPACLARLAIQAYSAARCMALGGIVEGPFFPKRGIVA
eukprot:5198278-Pyramimonas_sp.AAC.1